MTDLNQQWKGLDNEELLLQQLVAFHFHETANFAAGYCKLLGFVLRVLRTHVL